MEMEMALVERAMDLLGTTRLPWEEEGSGAWRHRLVNAPDGVGWEGPLRTYVERTWDKRYYLRDGDGDRYAYLHPNGICVLGFAPTHEAVVLARKAKGSQVCLEYNRKWDTTKEFQFAGKQRKNAPILQENTEVCNLRVGRKIFSVRCGVQARLLELNGKLVRGGEEAALWHQRPATEGWLAIVQLLCKPEEIVEATVSMEEYVKEREDDLKGLFEP
ncbi:hypothetical protein HOP50_04g27740 [Chloropicon primus]|uniref:Uncharacterized protein n=1 Tax=Chloropicon primus TaxID=1764295 RepID=A0A5B8MIH9_9CHLO|nr:hypothetical protein A3770_04p27750 [Chloropicon primus]UPQ99466.1 hypothetical protein HOP50_04g27740 [Chloropicon primus]|eukprot:QDZ20257.1 hypothetical protein A3770_04p27750 [Chloropicon primus]